MRKVLILLALLPGLAFADSVGGPTANNGIQTASPQTGAASSSVLQPAPDAANQQLSAPNSPVNLLQGSTPTSADQLTVEADGAPQTLSSGGFSSALATALLAAAAVVIALAAVAIWQLSIRGTS